MSSAPGPDTATNAILFDERLAAARSRATAGAYLEATSLLDEALRLCPADDARRRSLALALLAHNYPRLGNLQASVRCAGEAVALSEHVRDPAVLADALTSLSFVYAQLLMGRDALDCGLRALAAARQAQDRLREGWALNRIGVSYSSLDNPAQGCEMAEQAIEIVHRAQLTGGELHFSCVNNLAYFWLSRCRDALRGGTAQQLRDALREAQDQAERALVLARYSTSPFQIAVAASNLVEALLLGHEYAAAEPLLVEFEQLAEAHGYQALSLQAAAQRAMILKSQGDAAGATLRLAGLLGRGGIELPPKQRRVVIHALYELHKAGGEYREALGYLEQHADLERQIARDTMALQTEVMLIRQEVDQAQARAEHALQDAQRERERASRLEREQQHLRDQAAALDRAAHEDVLTGLHNRRHTEFALPLLVEGARLAEKEICLAMLDVDHFKRVNDDFGHAIGDLVLQQLAQLLRTRMRSADLLARVGGEEFLIALVGSTPEQAQEVCERLREAVAAFDWTAIAAGLAVRISIGLAGGTPPEEARVLVERADLALYAAKRGGRDRVHVDHAS